MFERLFKLPGVSISLMPPEKAISLFPGHFSQGRGGTCGRGGERGWAVEDRLLEGRIEAVWSVHTAEEEARFGQTAHFIRDDANAEREDADPPDEAGPLSDDEDFDSDDETAGAAPAPTLDDLIERQYQVRRRRRETADPIRRCVFGSS